jgi:serine/threonine-protein kinase HipA
MSLLLALQPEVLDVYLNGKLVGHFGRERTGAVDFRYSQSWLDWDNAIPVSLSLPLREDHYTGDPVIAVFDNLLPDTSDIRRSIAAKTGASGNDPHSLLAAIGRDCVGALQFLPRDAEPPDVSSIQARRLNDEAIAGIIGNLARNPLGIEENRDFRISIAGAQEKTALLRRNGHWYMPLGTTPTTHILKPQIGLLSNGIDMSRSVENEHFCLTLASAIGIPSANTRIVDFGQTRVLVVERFDRTWTRDKRLLRIPQEDCCQSLSVPSSRKYQSDGGPTALQIASLLQGSDQPEADRKLFFKALVLFWLLGATDGHAKNFSVHLKPGGRFRMTPLYDVLSLQPAADAKKLRHTDYKLAMSVGDNKHYVVKEVAPRHFMQDGEKARLPRGTMDTVFAELIAAAHAALETAANAMPPDCPSTLIDSIARGFKRRLAEIEKHAA